MTINKNINEIELNEFKYLIDSRDLTDKEKNAEKDGILAAIAKRFKSRTKEELISLRLLQLQYQMEDYVNNIKCNSGLSFSRFLGRYVDTLYELRKDFAKDIDVKPITISHIINNHREPKDVFLYRLMLHSEKVYKTISNFDKELWPKVYYQDKICQFLTSTENMKAEKIKVSSGQISADI